MPSQPIGYIEPEEGEKIALGLADAMNPPEPPARSLSSSAATGGAQLSPQPFTGLGSGIITNGFGQAPNARSSQPLLGLNCT